MNAYLSQNKPLVVLMPDAQDDLLVSQSEAFAGRAADLTNRDIVIVKGLMINLLSTVPLRGNLSQNVFAAA